MDFKKLFEFLEELQNNNNKEWMDVHRKRYQQIRNEFIKWLDGLNAILEAGGKDYYSTPGKRGINRINNNLMFHPNKPVYKDHFGAGLDKAPNSADFYIEIGLKHCMLAGGFWRPGPKTLRNIREGIDFDGDKLMKILEKKSFKQTFGDLYEDEKLTNAPKGFSSDHPHIHLLRNKTFAVVHELKRDEVFKPNFNEKVIAVYNEMLPFRRYLNKAAML